MSSLYKGTKVNYMKSQAQIGKILSENKIRDKIFFDKASEKEIWLIFKYEMKIESNNVPIGVKIIIPNVDEKNRDSRYRLLFWYLKSKFEAINGCLFEDINTSFVKEFYPHLLVNKGQTIYEQLSPSMSKALLNGDLEQAKLQIDFIKDKNEEID